MSVLAARIEIFEDDSKKFADLSREEIEALRTLAKSPAFRMLAGLDAPVFKEKKGRLLKGYEHRCRRCERAFVEVPGCLCMRCDKAIRECRNKSQ